jgi:glycosyltransferase 2 family protein
MQSSSRKLLFILAGLLVLGLIIYRSSGLIHLTDFSGAKLLHAVRSANPYLLLLAILAIYVCYALRSLRWVVFQRNLGSSRFGIVYGMTLAGFAAVFLLGRAGEPVRPLLLARKEKLPVSGMFGVYVLERLFDIASTAVIAAIGLLLFESYGHVGETAGRLETAARTTGSLLVAGVAAAIVFLVYLRLHGTALLERRLQGWLRAHGWRASVAGILLGFARGVQTIRSWGDLALAVFYSAAHWFLVLMTYVWVLRAFGGKLGTLGFGDAMLVLAFTMVGSAVQVPTIGGGSQAGSIVALTAIFGVEMEPAVAAAIVLWLITFAACSLAGVPLLIHEGFSLGKLREMAEHEKEVAVEGAAGQGESAP